MLLIYDIVRLIYYCLYSFWIPPISWLILIVCLFGGYVKGFKYYDSKSQLYKKIYSATLRLTQYPSPTKKWDNNLSAFLVCCCLWASLSSSSMTCVVKSLLHLFFFGPVLLDWFVAQNSGMFLFFYKQNALSQDKISQWGHLRRSYQVDSGHVQLRVEEWLRYASHLSAPVWCF